MKLTKLGNSERAVSGAAFNHKRDIEGEAIDKAGAHAERDDETHQTRSLGRSGQRQFPQEGLLDVSLHSGAFTSPADCVLRIIKFGCQEGTMHAACSKLHSGTRIPCTVANTSRFPEFMDYRAIHLTA